MPLLMMRHRRVPRAMWRDRQTNLNKHWIEQVRSFFFSILNAESSGTHTPIPSYGLLSPLPPLRIQLVCHQKNICAP
jgi:hypothetical protein